MQSPAIFVIDHNQPHDYLSVNLIEFVLTT